MLREVADLGFSHVELSHGIRITLVPGILKAMDEGFIKVSSTHNFCPLPTGIVQAAPNLFEPSSSAPQEHDQWLRQTKRSLDFGQQVKARVLVLHLGSVKFGWFNPTGKLDAYFGKHPGVKLAEDERYVALRDKVMKKMQAKKAAYWNQVKASLEEIRPYAAERGIALGCENREDVAELPIDGEFEELLSGMTQPNTAGYWHDTGHAHIKEQLALLNHREHLEKNAARLIGFHLHDVNAAGKDHQPVGAGEIDFEMVSSFWKAHHLLTLEFGPRISVESVKESKLRIEALVAKRFPQA
ncbi:xylose isomerase [Nibricoccus aquaticus]|uniref:Xylose isomerase n=2 Tax=Nibricoccus aquaticus TaxID=2576891 RepID=A0A290QFV0_9BACT|nr:xylose isomerase [Nibricoccus aquaticus]